MGELNTILHAQLEFSFHNIFDDTFHQGFTAWSFIDLGNHLVIDSPFILQVLGFAIVGVMGFGNPV